MTLGVAANANISLSCLLFPIRDIAASAITLFPEI